jgi:hypothetical protein
MRKARPVGLSPGKTLPRVRHTLSVHCPAMSDDAPNENETPSVPDASAPQLQPAPDKSWLEVDQIRASEPPPEMRFTTEASAAEER